LVLVVGAVGGVGAMARLLVDSAVSARGATAFPYGTFVVNIVGAFLLGLLVGAALDANAFRVVGSGLVGAFTTFSTWVLESQRLGEDGEFQLAIANFAISLALGILAAWAGRHLGMAL
jgi:CrcB protein